jgi:hypothetical protein
MHTVQEASASMLSVHTERTQWQHNTFTVDHRLLDM